MAKCKSQVSRPDVPSPALFKSQLSEDLRYLSQLATVLWEEGWYTKSMYLDGVTERFRQLYDKTYSKDAAPGRMVQGAGSKG